MSPYKFTFRNFPRAFSDETLVGQLNIAINAYRTVTNLDRRGECTLFTEAFLCVTQALSLVIATMTGTNMVFVKIQLVYGKTYSIKL